MGGNVFTWTILLTAGLAGCLGSGTDADRRAAVELRILRGAEKSPDMPGYDVLLPGYHVRGGIGTVELAPLGEGAVRAFALALTTSPGMRPNLEAFSLSVGDTIYTTSPFGPEQLLDIMPRRPDDYGGTVSRVRLEEYFRFSTSGGEVIVRFGPRGLELLKRSCVVSWVDWYRR